MPARPDGRCLRGPMVEPSMARCAATPPPRSSSSRHRRPACNWTRRRSLARSCAIIPLGSSLDRAWRGSCRYLANRRITPQDMLMPLISTIDKPVPQAEIRRADLEEIAPEGLAADPAARDRGRDRCSRASTRRVVRFRSLRGARRRLQRIPDCGDAHPRAGALPETVVSLLVASMYPWVSSS